MQKNWTLGLDMSDDKDQDSMKRAMLETNPILMGTVLSCYGDDIDYSRMSSIKIPLVMPLSSKLGGAGFKNFVKH